MSWESKHHTPFNLIPATLCVLCTHTMVCEPSRWPRSYSYPVRTLKDSLFTGLQPGFCILGCAQLEILNVPFKVTRGISTRPGHVSFDPVAQITVSQHNTLRRTTAI